MSVDPSAPEIVTQDLVTLMNAARTCVLVHDAETKNILWANPAACELLGWPLDELRPLKANDMSSTAPQYHRVLGRAWLQEAVERGSSRIEWHYRTRSGRVVPTDALARRVELAQGPAVMVEFRDIEREQATEQALRRTTSSIDALARHTSTIALTLDAAGTVRFATDTALALLGMVPEDMGRPLDELGTLRVGGRPVTWADLVARAAPTAEVQLQVPRPDDEVIWLEGTLERLAETDGDGLLMILHDVSGRVHREVLRERELQRENYQARYTAMGDMAMAIAHELGQPLAAAGNFLAGTTRHAGVLEDEGTLSHESADRLRFGIGSAVRQIDRASAIVGAVRAFVGHLEHTSQVVDLHDVVDECLYFVRLRAAEPGVRVVLHRHPEPLPAVCERVLTGQVLLNLCFNAIDEMTACPQGERELVITTGGADGEAVLTVEDSGRGLVRDPFAESFTSKEEGSGIGLALSYRIVTRQHGRIWAEAREGGGSRFGFALPLSADRRPE
ncbi:ATP-binding protein [Pseudonocardia sp. RS11V-5]|uniref:PAS domain-containing sensor histidine kinase n=1 Tax=Pseudonocardia terrae TaxID=2905831 RepID=UPI001E29F3A1|nr:ATP-binding protein [Pseudonocardia terrae]MCE3551235.1 ATP-binding protein [Pseudonocardia terrae]